MVSQPEYKIFKKAFKEKLPKEPKSLDFFANYDEIMRLNVSLSWLIEEMAKDMSSPADIEWKFEMVDNVPDPRDLEGAKKNLMIFDDLLLEKQNKCKAYYTRSRRLLLPHTKLL